MLTQSIIESEFAKKNSVIKKHHKSVINWNFIFEKVHMINSDVYTFRSTICSFIQFLNLAQFICILIAEFYQRKAEFSHKTTIFWYFFAEN